MRRLVIAIDCDDVLVSTGEMTIAAYNRKYGTKLTPEFYYDKATLATWGTDDDSLAIERVMEYERSPEYALIRPVQETVDVVNRLAALHELHLVTGRPDHLEEVTLGMLERYFSGCFTSVEHTNFYNEKKRTKGEVCKLLGADILIDDHIGHGESVLVNGMKEVIIFGDYPWNRHQALSAGMVRCFDWLGVEREINRIANAQ
jgi:FMN phosphatase YigB (HAD superfamily)